MKKQTVNIVWQKLDLQLQGYKPLSKREKADLPYPIIYWFAPKLISYPDISIKHLQFLYYSLQVMNEPLSSFHKTAGIFYAKAMDVFMYLNEQFNIKNLLSFYKSRIQSA